MGIAGRDGRTTRVKMSRQRGIILLALLVSVLLTLVTLIFFVLPNDTLGVIQADNHPTATKVPGTATPWQDPLTAAHTAFIPTHIIVPAMHLDADVIPVGATPDGAMSTPHCQTATDPICGEVYWWSGGVVPGQTGNAVLAGHVNRPDASPASFGSLPLMKVGDTFQVRVANGQTLTFEVQSIETVTAYAKGQNNPIISEIFGPSTHADLNLITCIGDWDGATFDHRLIVHTRIVGTSPFPQP